MRVLERFVLGASGLVALALLAACGNGNGGGGATVGTSGTPSTPSGARHVVTVSTSTAPVTLKVGDTLVVRAPAGGMPRAYFTVQPGGEAVLAPAPGDKNARQAEFHAAAPGDATVAVSGGPICSPGQMCPAIRTLVGRVQVHVTP